MTYYLLSFFDKILSLFFLIFLFPFIIIILFLIFISDLITVILSLKCLKSPFFVQKRIGVGLSSFYIYKFRSMKIEKKVSSTYKTTSLNDERITRTGFFMRKYSLDELPQLINILQGHMSFVGPRPVTIHEENNFSKDHWIFRHSVKPGLSGLSQIYKPKSIMEQQKLERLTIESSSLLFYFSIILKTFKVFNKNS